MTIGAVLIGLCGFALDASAQTSKACAKHEAVVYFAPESSSLNEYSDYAIDRMAEAARACGAQGVVIQATASNRDRTFAVASALSGRGVKPVIVPAGGLQPLGDTMVARSVTIRVSDTGNPAS